MLTANRRRVSVITGVLVMTVVVAAGMILRGNFFEDDFYTIDGGGGMFLADSVDGVYEFSGTIGQPDGGILRDEAGVFELVGGFWGAPDADPITRLYVKWDAVDGANDGTDWTNAFLNLQDALARAVELESLGEDIQEIWVARGVYHPDMFSGDPNAIDDPDAAFELINGIAMYGNFAGTERTLDERDPYNPEYETILTGEIGDPNDPDDNSHHVVVASDTDLTTRLDGFTITGGNANGSGASFADVGGGLYNPAGSALIVRCTFLGNAADTAGGAADTSGNSATTFVNCRFLGNVADFAGGVYVDGSGNQTSFMNCTFSGNETRNGDGGAVRVDIGTAPEFVNCTLVANTAATADPNVPADAGGIHVNGGAVTITSCILWDNYDSGGLPDESAQILVVAPGSADVNYCNVQDYSTLGGVGNIGDPATDDPVFVDADGADDTAGTRDDDLRISYLSPCIDSGDNTAVPADLADLDHDGNPSEPTPIDLGADVRFQDDPTVDPDPGNGVPPIVDMGAYEFRFEDCNNNGVIDSFDVDPNDPDGNGEVSPDCQPDGIPDECQLSGDRIDSRWNTGSGSWNVPGNWCPGLDFPNNEDSDPTYGFQRFFVAIDQVDGFDAPLVNLNTSPTISQLALGADAEIRLSGGTNRTLSFQDPNTVSTSAGVIRVRSSGLDITLTLSDLTLEQLDPNAALLEADGVVSNPERDTILRLVDSTIAGGRLQAINGGELRVYNTVLNAVSVRDAVVEDDNTSRVADVINNASQIRVGEAGVGAVLAALPGGATLTGGGRILLISETGSTLSGASGTLTNAADHTVEGTGQILGSLHNLGEINANVPGAELIVSGSETVVQNDGMLAATNGGILRALAPFSGVGGLLAQGGTIYVGGSGQADAYHAGEIEVLPGSLGYLFVEGGGVSLAGANLAVTGGETLVRDGATLNLIDDVLVSQDPNHPGAVAHLSIESGNSMSAGNQVVIGDLDTQSAGHVLVDGLLEVTGSGVFLEYGTLSGSGVIDATVYVTGGTLMPGSSAGELIIDGDYSQSDGTLAIDIGGASSSEYDLLTVSGVATLGGDLELALIDNFVPVFGDSFTIISAGSLSEQFDQVIAPGLPAQLEWDVIYDVAEVRLEIYDICPTDLDDDGEVGLADLAVLLAHYGVTSGATLEDGDLNGDGGVDLVDLATLLADYGTTCD